MAAMAVSVAHGCVHEESSGEEQIRLVPEEGSRFFFQNGVNAIETSDHT